MSRFHPFLLLSCLVPAVALASFPIDVETHAEGVDISATSDDVSNVATVTVTNNGDNNAECEATFVSGPERPFPRRTILEAGESAVLTQAFERAITRVRVTLNCKAK
ncbi:MAG: 3-phosphoglycerate kinase [Halopseudomonas sp.]|uniref:3-phosphoglycerate kinase n=1 Tax=Halopseudomonas sp. TaxID=2901191 RepID=UPI003003788B